MTAAPPAGQPQTEKTDTVRKVRFTPQKIAVVDPGGLNIIWVHGGPGRDFFGSLHEIDAQPGRCRLTLLACGTITQKPPMDLDMDEIQVDKWLITTDDEQFEGEIHAAEAFYFGIGGPDGMYLDFTETDLGLHEITDEDIAYLNQQAEVQNALNDLSRGLFGFYHSMTEECLKEDSRVFSMLLSLEEAIKETPFEKELDAAAGRILAGKAQ